MDISCSERMEYPLRFIWRIFLILIVVFLLKDTFISKSPQAYIGRSLEKPWIERIEWEVQQIQKAAQDLPASIEVVIKRLFRDIKPHVEAKSV